MHTQLLTFMKKILLLLAVQLFVATTIAQTKVLPATQVKTLEGAMVNVQDLGKTGKVMVIIFWATWNSPSKNELDVIKDYYPDWKENYGIELVALSADDPRTAAKIPAMVAEKGWEYRILHDASREFMEAANITALPYTIVLDKSGNIAFEHIGYTPGDELELGDKIKSLAK